MPLLCYGAADTLMQGDSVVSYTVHGGAPGPHTLPYTAIFGKQSISSNPFPLSYSYLAGNCKIWVEVAGPATPQTYEAIPNEIRGMAGWVVDECVRSGEMGFGGFATRDISTLTQYVTKPDTKISRAYRK